MADYAATTLVPRLRGKRADHRAGLVVSADRERIGLLRSQLLSIVTAAPGDPSRRLSPP
jgi:hypothetical protein